MFVINELHIINYQLSIINYQLSIINYQLIRMIVLLHIRNDGKCVSFML
jgi:hypothetical protein